MNRDPSEVSVLDIGCGEGKDVVYMARKGCKVTAFDLTESGIRKTKKLAENAFVAMWKTGELFTYFGNWKIRMIKESIFEDNSGGVKHYHCMDSIMAEKV